MSRVQTNLGRWFACACAGALLAYVYAVLRVDDVAHDASLSAWQWFRASYGAYVLRGLLLGATAGALLVWLSSSGRLSRRQA